MKNFFHAVLVLPLVLFAAACSKSDDGTKSVELTGGTESQQTVYADEKQAPAPIRFTAKAAWTATVAEVTTKAEGDSEVDWLDLSAYSGGAGNVSLTMTLSPNYTGADRKAEIRIECAGTSISITVEQKGTTEQGEVPEDPDKPEPIELNDETPTQQTVYADDEQAPAPIKFTATAPWTATIAEVATKAETGNEVDWLALSAYSGDAGEASLTMTLTPNYTGHDRKAEIRIACGETIITVTVEQKATKADGTMPESPNKPENPDDKGLLDADGNILFPDAKFAAYMVKNFDTDRDGKISVKEAATITRIECIYMGIESLAGIEYCTELDYLDCGSNQLTTLDVSGRTALTDLRCSDNQLTTLNVSGCTALTKLWCYNNQLTTLNVNGCTALTELWCYDNQLTTLDVNGCTALTYLWCSDNQLTTLNINGCTALTKLSCDGNQLTTLDVSKNTELTELNCASNQLTALDVSGRTALTDLRCSDNQLTTLNVSGCTALTGLYYGDNPLTTLDVSGCTALTYLYCDRYQLTSLDVSGCTALTTLYCDGNQLTTLDVSGCTALTKLYCGNNQLTTLDVSMTNLGNATDSIPLSCNMTTLQTLYLKRGWMLNGININYSTFYINEHTQIEYKD